MGKNKNKKGQRDGDAGAGSSIESSSNPSEGLTSTSGTSASSVASNNAGDRRILNQLIFQERRGVFWVVILAVIGSWLGFGLGSGILGSSRPATWKSSKLRITAKLMTLQIMPWDLLKEGTYATWDDDELLDNEEALEFGDVDLIMDGNPYHEYARGMVTLDSQILRSDPSHPTVFAVLREAVVREKGGYVHPDLGILDPAPSGAARGLGMVRNDWHVCQNICNPGTREEKIFEAEHGSTLDPKRTKNYKQEEVLLKIPLVFQMTRSVALETLIPVISEEVQNRASLHELDDAALLVLLLAHERGKGKYSRWLPYIASLPLQPSCGFARETSAYKDDSMKAYAEEVGLDTSAWKQELHKATQYAERVATGLARDYGQFIFRPEGVSGYDNILWALCQVSSRATAGSQAHGSLRLVPMADLVNHDATAGGFVELTGKESFDEGDFLNATEADSGAFVVRSLRHGRRKALRVGQELLVNYNVPHYSALDWYMSLGFVPPERWNEWEKVDPGLPRVRRDGPFGVPGARDRYMSSSSHGGTSGNSGSGMNTGSSYSIEL